MAEGEIQGKGTQFKCSICQNTYTNPKILHCFHVFCQQCLVPQGQLSVTCPTCRQVTPIPANGVAGLHPAFHISYLLDSIKDIANLPGSTGDPSKNVTECCSEHVEEELKLHCKTCGELICYKCALKCGKHCNHDYEELDKAFEKYKEEIVKNIEPMEKQVAIVKKALALIKQNCREISNQGEAIESSIHVTFRRLREVLTARETELIRQLHQMTQGKLKSLAAQSGQIETTLAQLNSCLHFMKESKVGNAKATANVIHQAKELGNPFKATSFHPEPNAKANMIFSVLESLTAACENYGQVLAVDVTNKDSEPIVVGEKFRFIVRSVNFEDKGCMELTKLKYRIFSEITGTPASFNTEKRGEVQRELSYQPTIKGRHQLRIKLGDQYIRGSPSSIAVKLPIEKLGTPILTIARVARPRGVAVNQSDGEVIVTEGGIHCVSVFNPSGKKLRSFGTRGSGKGEFIDPRGVAVDRGGNILVADNSNKRIQKFTVEGKFLAAVDIKGPTDIAFNTSNNKVYVVDYISHQIQVLNSDLTFSSTFGNKGSDKGQFNGPWGIACDSTGKVYVTDLHNHRVQVFTAEGKFIRMFGRRGQDKGQLADPYFISVDTSGMVYVSECDNSRISVFTSEGRYVTSFGKKGAGPGEFNFQYGIAVDNSGVVYVCDSDNNRVLFF